MEWYYVEAGQRVGPVTNAQFDEMVRIGKITPETLVWKEGMAQWEPYKTAGSAKIPPAPGSTAGGVAVAVCAECQRSFKIEEMMPYQNTYVCAQCKPTFLQRLREGASPALDRGLWRKGKDLVMPVGAQLPARCAKCGEPVSTQPIRRKLYWHSQWIYLLILFNLLIYALVAIIVRKKAVVDVPICPQHRKRRAQVIAASWLMILLSIGLFILAANVKNSEFIVLCGIGLFLTGIIFGLVKGTLVRAAKIDERFVWVRGFGPPFLAPLPEWTGPS